MLKQRIITALVLLAILLPALFYATPVPFTVVMLALIGAAAWEWGRLNGHGPRMSVFLGIEMVVLCAFSWWAGLIGQDAGPGDQGAGDIAVGAGRDHCQHGQSGRPVGDPTGRLGTGDHLDHALPR